ncbi:MAG: NarK family nitrate/nitrite MFS transporter [Cyanosarcina radialis HA8281-LM2]|nr:NarK family nitrate/nitrite MFS transporter [Cyanosarcina radialis HA8281-LM2]
MLKEMWSFRGQYRILHLTWLAFFLTFVCWFNFAPFTTTIETALNITPIQIKTILICNLALTIPARIAIGMILDRLGPRITFSALLMFAAVPCIATAISQDFYQLLFSRLLMGIVGAGFVVGIRMVSEWFPAKDIGLAQGIYGGWGNFGAFGAEFALPSVALGTAFLADGASNWRLAIALTGIITAIYGWIYYCNVQDTPPGKTYKKAKRSGGMEVTSAKSFYAMLAMNLGLILAMGLLAWRLARPELHFLTNAQMLLVWLFLAGLYAFQTYQTWQVNREVLGGGKTYTPAERYQFRQIALLELAYATSFGSELTAASILPTFFEHTFSLEHVAAGAIAASYPFMNLVARPAGGSISDKLGSRKWTLTILAVGIGTCYAIARQIDSTWPMGLAIAVMMVAAGFSQASSGANSSIVPLIKPEMTGQIAGNVGAYGNLGAVVYLTIFSLTDAPTLFATMGVAALVSASLCAFFLREPKGSFAKSAQEIGKTAPMLIDGSEP